jgi:hypothetical protein
VQDAVFSDLAHEAFDHPLWIFTRTGSYPRGHGRTIIKAGAHFLPAAARLAIPAFPYFFLPIAAARPEPLSTPFLWESF